MKKISEFPPAEEMPWATAVKAFIVNEKEEVLVLKRNSNLPHSPGAYDIPGGRLDNGEALFLGLKREVREETGLEVEIGPVLAVNHFTRDDLQRITMLIFLCSIEGRGKVSLREKEAVSFEWLSVKDAEKQLSKFTGVVENYMKFFKGRWPSSL